MDHQGADDAVDVQRVAPLLSVLEVAHVLGVSERKVRRLVWLGRMRHVRVGDRVLVTVEDLRSFIEANRR